MKKQTKLRRSGIRIMASLIVLLGSLAWVMLLAVLNGALGFASAMGVTFFGALGIAKALGENVALSYTCIFALSIGCGVLRGLLRYLEQYSNHYIAFKLLAVLREKIFAALRRLCPAKLESREKGAIIAMLTSDIETLEVFYAHTISPICIAVLISLAVVVLVGCVASWYLSLVALLAYLLIGVVVPLVSAARLKASGVAYRAEFSDFNAFFLDSIKGVKDIVLHNAGPLRQREVNQRSARLLEETKKMKHDTTAATAFTELAVSVSVLFTLAVGIVLASLGEITPGWMIVGVVLVFSSFGPVIAISALPGNLTQTFASGERVLSLLEETPAVLPVEDGQALQFRELTVDGLSFSYDGQTQVLSDVCMHARQGEIVGIVGPSGCGKSTLLKLLLRFWQKQYGSIAYNGVEIDRIDSDSLLDNVTMVSQTTYLFDETIEENLCLARRDATPQELEEACRLASIHERIMELPEGYQTRAGTLGDRLSAGERQRIGLARAFLRGSGLILLDEPTSNVDSINEGIILRGLKEQRHEKSIILVSHRVSTMAIADRIYTVKDGRIYES